MKRRKLTEKERNEVYGKCNGHCAYCGCDISLSDMNADHVVSLHNRGADDMQNLMPSCHDCNYYKKGSNPEGFRKKLKKAFRKEKKCGFVLRLEEKYRDWNGLFYFERTSHDFRNDSTIETY